MPVAPIDIGGQRVAVHLIRGAIDVTRAEPRTSGTNEATSGSPLITHMTKGQNLVFDNSSAEPPKSTVEERDGPNTVVVFDDISLADLVKELNAYAHPPIILGDASLGRLRISGTFNLRDTRHTAEQIADFLALAVIYSGNGLTLSRRCPAELEVHCRPPS